MRIARLAVAATTAIGVAIIGACGTLPGTHEISAPPALVCGGSPSSCIIAKSNLDAMHPGYVFVDDKMAGLVLKGQTARFPMTSGQAHQLRFCAVYDNAEKKEWRCSIPIASLPRGNTLFVLEPLGTLPYMIVSADAAMLTTGK